MNPEDQLTLQTLLAASITTEPTVASAVSEVRRSVATDDDPYLWAWSMLELADALAHTQEWDKAKSVASSIDDIAPSCGYEKALAYYRIAIELRKANNTSSTEQALVLLDTALATVQNAGDEWQRAELLNRIAKTLSDTGESAKAQQTWGQAIAVARVGEQGASPQDRVDSSSVLWEISTTLAECGRVEQARDVASKILWEAKRQRAVAGVEQIAQRVP